MTSETISLPSGLVIPDALGRLRWFCRGEYAYYDGIGFTDPDRIEPLDVLVTVAMNSFVNSAARVHRVHQGMAAACDPILPQISVDAHLLAPGVDLSLVEALLDGACRVSGVLLPVATKVLHRKRRALIPMLDNVVLGHYLAPPELAPLRGKTQDGRQAASVATVVLDLFRTDLTASIVTLQMIGAELALEGPHVLTPVRMLEILIWMETEPLGAYRRAAPDARRS